VPRKVALSLHLSRALEGLEMNMPSVVTVRPTAIFELEELVSLPCGCVAAAYRARALDLAVVSLEAKGTYCNVLGHVTGQILRLGDPEEPESDDDLDE
jgi:hypothetical protein